MSNTTNFAFPAGKVDFTKTIRNVDSKDSATVLNVLSGDYPILIETGGQAYLVDGDGDDRDGNSVVENLPALPDVTLYGVIYTNTYEDTGYSISDTLYNSAKSALDDHSDDDDFLGVIEINPLKQQAGAAPAVSAGTAAATTTASDDGDESEGDTTADTGPKELSIYLGNYGTRTVRVGDMLRAHRKGFGTRTVEVKKLRNDRTKSVLVQANDGTGAYWAFNKNLSLQS